MMVVNMHVLVLLCFGVASFVLAIPVNNGISDDNSDDSVVIDGDYILKLANITQSSLVMLIGQVYKNFEVNVNKVAHETRIEALQEQICEHSECERWPEWPECPALKGDYTLIYRSRECGRNVSKCSYPEYKYRTETESTLCAGNKDPEPPKEDAHEVEVKEEELVDSESLEKTTGHPPSETSTAALVGHCPHNYEHIDGFCLQLVTSFKLPYNMASTLCAWDNGSLFDVDTVEHQRALHTLLNKHSLDKHNPDDPVWIDGFKPPGTGYPFEYLDGTEPEVDFWEGEPASDFPSTPEGVCKVDLGINVQKWSAMPCTSTKLHFVCTVGKRHEQATQSK